MYKRQGVAVYAIAVGIDHDIKAAYLRGAVRRLNYRYPGDYRGLAKHCVAVAADYNIDSPARVEIRGKLLVRLKADMGQENRKVYIDGLIAVADLSVDIDFTVLLTHIGFEDVYKRQRQNKLGILYRKFCASAHGRR